MINDQKTLTVSILGRNYSLLTDEKDEIVQEAAQLVEKYLKQTASSSSSPTELIKRTTFVALRVAVDLIKERNEKQTFNNKTEALNSLLKDSLV